MGKFIVPAIVLALGGGAAYLGYRVLKSKSETGASASGIRGRLGQAIRPKSEWEKNKSAEGILFSL